MRIARIFLKPPHNGAFVDISISEQYNISAFVLNFKMDGYVTREPQPGEGAPFAVPWDGWSFIAFLTLPDVQQQGRPAGIAFDFGVGKPN